ncbi:MAG: ABC transporter ATP-binding protein [Thermoplasmatales archaeon]|nr:ABC transporter ATP-binding protein [Thermoplasmatales archaeon]
MKAIEVNGISKIYRQKSGCKVALEDVSFYVEEGEIFGLLGPNGSGKTTLIKIIFGLIPADKGDVSIFGYKIPKERAKIISKINVVFSRAGCYWNLTGRDHLKFYGKIYRVKNLNEKIEKLVKLFEMEDKIDRSVDKYSTGEVMRLNLARSLLNEPILLILDEPTIGLDPMLALKIRDYLIKLNEEKGITILLTTHYMEEADRLCKRVAIINEGKIVAIDSPSNLKSKLKREKICEIGVSNLSAELLKKIKEKFEKCSYYESKSVLRVILKKYEDVAEIIDFLKNNGASVTHMHTEKPTLEDVFLYMTGKRLRDLNENF